ncbi:hypothetical protein Tco_0909803 [Tanacetum coccineum]|uniref:Uncharacterized protein n=1 Tax=Tanacetum coccineum TaxID=301880 RepID=A0ABQ5CRH7_9ASTR
MKMSMSKRIVLVEVVEVVEFLVEHLANLGYRDCWVEIKSKEKMVKRLLIAVRELILMIPPKMMGFWMEHWVDYEIVE